MISITENKVHECNHPHSSYVQYIYDKCEDVTQGWLIDIEGIMININYCPFCGIKLDMEGEIIMKTELNYKIKNGSYWYTMTPKDKQNANVKEQEELIKKFFEIFEIDNEHE